MNYAVIENGKVANVIVAEPWGAKSLEGVMTLVAVEDRPVTMGDEYKDGDFYRDGEKILTPSESLFEYYNAMQEVIDE